MVKMKTSKGKQKIEIKKIIDKNSRQVTFTKRRNGLFSKCSELCSKFGSEIAVITFSIAGKPKVSGYPSADEVLQRYISQSSNRCRNWWDNPIDNLGLDDLERFKTKLEGLRDEVVSRVHQINRFNSGEIKDDSVGNEVSDNVDDEFSWEIDCDAVCAEAASISVDEFQDYKLEVEDDEFGVDSSYNGDQFSWEIRHDGVCSHASINVDQFSVDTRINCDQFPDYRFQDYKRGIKEDEFSVGTSTNGDQFPDYNWEIKDEEFPKYQFPDYFEWVENKVPNFDRELLPVDGSCSLLDLISCH
ncbi:hypothetical protein RND81_07G154700 [Saponaria officinalis]|uniref:MADS-box domain-containing protein n=1 Tax=Saponaria officinalis TaxID=3572 RepID=A0AAW1JSC0_SAPOF